MEIEKPNLFETVKYSFTITLKPHLYKFTNTEQFDLTSDLLVKDLSNMGITKVTMIAENTQSFNIHYHGVITWFLTCGTMKDIRNRFIDSFRRHKNIGFVNIKQIDDEVGWKNYISKELEETYINTDRRPILKDDFDYFTPEDYARYGTFW